MEIFSKYPDVSINADPIDNNYRVTYTEETLTGSNPPEVEYTMLRGPFGEEYSCKAKFKVVGQPY